MVQQVEQRGVEREGHEETSRQDATHRPESDGGGWFPARPRVANLYPRREPAHEFDFGNDGMEN